MMTERWTGLKLGHCDNVRSRLVRRYMTTWKIREKLSTDSEKGKGIYKTRYHAQGDGVKGETYIVDKSKNTRLSIMRNQVLIPFATVSKLGHFRYLHDTPVHLAEYMNTWLQTDVEICE